MAEIDLNTLAEKNILKDRDYSLNGSSAKKAIELGLASAQWYHSDIPRKSIKALMRRSDKAALIDTLVWFGLLFITGFCGVIFWGKIEAIPFFIVYGVLYGSVSDSRWHECGHGTAFKTPWMNDFVYHIASFMVVRNPITWHWSHARHHTDTIIVGRDPEIALVRPPNLLEAGLRFIGVIAAPKSLQRLVRNSLGFLTCDEKNYIPAEEISKVVFWARIHSMIYIATIISCFIFSSFLPLMLVGLPRLYGCWHMVMMGLLQHGGLAEDVTDHRMNSRTVYINPISRWLYWNMNYHVEHHMFPMIPYHALPKLHELIKHDLPKANTSIFNAYLEVIKAIWRQQTEPDYYIKKDLPHTAKQFRQEFH